jgi:hypothetical protein
MLIKLHTITVFTIAILIFSLMLFNQSAKAENLSDYGKFAMINLDDTMMKTADIFQKGNRTHLSNDFPRKKEPDLRALLHKQSWSQIQNDYVALRNLKNLKETEGYETREGMVLDDYLPVVVWLQKFSVGFGIVKLNGLEIIPLVDSFPR